MIFPLTVVSVLGLVTAIAAPVSPAPTPAKPTPPIVAVGNASLVAAARTQVGVTVAYDPAYRKLTYPGGDVPLSTGVCADVVVRALRAVELDLQKAVHEDMHKNFSAYPKNWGLKKPDTNIDHRRVPNLSTWFTRSGWSLPVSTSPSDYAPGDIVTWSLPGGLKHIGLVSDKKSAAGTPLVIHNIGSGAKEEDVLFAWSITGRFRKPTAKSS
jgi:uncharacterized protein YijF (DUF1287 family)